MEEVRLTERIDAAFDGGDVAPLANAEPVDGLDGLEALGRVHDLWLAPLADIGDRSRFQGHPAVAALKWRLEQDFVSRLEERVPPAAATDTDPAVELRRIARAGLPPVYAWLATHANWSQVVRFLAVEGGPDGGFDDLVALCQVGITGPPKVVLGANYWDEMGRGVDADVHTVLYDRLVAAVDMPRLSPDELPVSALERTVLNGVLATNRSLQPELIGALGLLELQAGPRCRQVVRALGRLGAPADALPFYEEHAHTDPRHGKAWLDGVLTPLAAEHPSWGAGFIRGARWRSAVDTRLFSDLHRLLVQPQARPA